MTLLLRTLFLAFHFSRLHAAEKLKHFFLFLLTLYIFDVYGHVELSAAPVSDVIFLSMNVAIIESLLVDFDKLLLALFPISIRTF